MEEVEPGWNHLRSTLVGTELGDGKAAAHAEHRDRGEQSGADRPYAERPAQTDFVEEGVEDEREDEATDAGAGEDDPTREAAPLGEPLWQELDDGHVDDTAADADTDALQQDELPHLLWGRVRLYHTEATRTNLGGKAGREEGGEVERQAKPHGCP